MRLEFGIAIEQIDVPRFSVEAVEGIGKLFTLATLVLNVMDARERVEIVFHGLNPEDPERKISAFREIVESCATARPLRIEPADGGRVRDSSSYFQWVAITR